MQTAIHPTCCKLCRSSRWAIVFLWVFLLWPCFEGQSLAQYQYMNAGPDNAFAQVDFAEMYLDQNKKKFEQSEKQKLEDKELIDSGAISAFDLQAPNNAVEQFNRASTLLKAQNSKDALKFLRKAIEDYPNFVSAHMALGRAYLDLDDKAHAREEYENAARIDGKYAAPLLNLGRLELSNNNLSAAESDLEKAASLRPKDARILSTLAFAQNGNHEYAQTLATVQRVHTLDHKGMAAVHYVAASAAMSVKDFPAVERELNIFLSEDPTNEYAPTALKNLAILQHNRTVLAASNVAPSNARLTTSRVTVTVPNSDRLKAELNGLGKESDCEDCGSSETMAAAAEGIGSASASFGARPRGANGMWTIRKSVDDVTVFFSATSHGHMVNDLQESEVQIRDNNKPPMKLLQFSPQSKLPLRLALLIDTSGSVKDRFSFEKNAAAKFVEKVLNHTSDLAFIEGFSSDTTITQDFSSDPQELGSGIRKLSNGGGTALFDAVAFACRKLGAYPESEHVARVVVLLSDGEDNSSHRSLKQSIDAAERAGVTVYAISTKEEHGDKTDADRILEELAQRSGGEAMFPGDVLTLGHSFDKLRELIRSRYFVAYKPADFQPDGSYRSISIVAEKDGKRLQVRGRKGYHARIDSTAPGPAPNEASSK